jgi:hypothetical protein
MPPTWRRLGLDVEEYPDGHPVPLAQLQIRRPTGRSYKIFFSTPALFSGKIKKRSTAVSFNRL